MRKYDELAQDVKTLKAILGHLLHRYNDMPGCIVKNYNFLCDASYSYQYIYDEKLRQVQIHLNSIKAFSVCVHGQYDTLFIKYKVGENVETIFKYIVNKYDATIVKVDMDEDVPSEWTDVG